MANKNIFILLGLLGIVAIPLVMAKKPEPPPEEAWIWDQARWDVSKWV